MCYYVLVYTTEYRIIYILYNISIYECNMNILWLEADQITFKTWIINIILLTILFTSVY